jgi:hypothetical protein
MSHTIRRCAKPASERSTSSFVHEGEEFDPDGEIALSRSKRPKPLREPERPKETHRPR